MSSLPLSSAQRDLQAVLARNLIAVRDRIAKASEGPALAAQAAGLPYQEPILIAVTKTVSPEVTQLLVELDGTELLGASGYGAPMDCGENRAGPFVEKADALMGTFTEPSATPRWHFIGHLQRNKVRRVLERADVLHSVDSTKLAGAVVRIAAELERPLEAFIEVNLTGEEEKHGLRPEEAKDAVEILAGSPWIHLRGLMAMAPLPGRGPVGGRLPRTAGDAFGAAAALARTLESQCSGAFINGACALSMGMSGDLEVAIEHGSDYVRIGSALFAGLPMDPSPKPSGPTPRP